MVRLSEFDTHCTFMIHPSFFLYSNNAPSLAGSLVKAAGMADKFSLSNNGQAYSNIPQQPNIADLQKRLESNKDNVKLQALKEVILWAIQPPSNFNEMTGIIGGSSLGYLVSNIASRLLVTIIRFVLPSENHEIKKLITLYWETVDKTDADGGLREELILVCNKWRQDLLHPNEYIRGVTARLLSKMRYVKILQPLLEPIAQNIKHSHVYVRRNALMCLYSMISCFGCNFISTAIEDVEAFLSSENDLTARRNAFLLLMNSNLNRAVEYCLSIEDKISFMGDLFQLAFLELTRRVLYIDTNLANSLLPMVTTLVNSSISPALIYEGASTLLLFPSSPVAVETATRAYILLLCREGDNNVKLSVLDCLDEILLTFPSALENFAVDIFRALSSPSLEIKKKTLAIGFKLVNKRTAHDIITIIKNELLKTLSLENQQVDVTFLTTYQQLLLQHLRCISTEFISLIEPMLPLLFGFLTDANITTANEVLLFFRKISVQCFQLCKKIVNGIMEILADIPHSSIACTCLWILGEFFVDDSQRFEIIDNLYRCLSPLPFSEQFVNTCVTKTRVMPSITCDQFAEKRLTALTNEEQTKVTTRTIILKDGTYGTEDVYKNTEKKTTDGSTHTIAPSKLKTSKLRCLIASFDSLLASVFAVTVTKLLLKTPRGAPTTTTPTISPKYHASCLLMVASLYKVCTKVQGCSTTSAAAVRILQMLHILTSLKDNTEDNAKLFNMWFFNFNEFVSTNKESSQDVILYENQYKHKPQNLSLYQNLQTLVDDPIIFSQLQSNQSALKYNELATWLHPDDDLKRALGKDELKQTTKCYEDRLMKVQQLTGLNDPVYIEAFIEYHQFDFLLEFVIINRTKGTLQNVSVELLTHGEGKLIERPKIVNVSPGQFETVYATIRVQSTETGVIFGHVTFSQASKSETENLVFSELHINLLNFMKPRSIGFDTFRTKWAEFEWENKISINTSFTDVAQYMKHILKKTNMTIVGKSNLCEAMQNSEDILTQYNDNPDPFEATLVYPKSSWKVSTKSDDSSPHDLTTIKQLHLLNHVMINSSFFAVNLYSKSIFDEDILANVSIEKLLNGKLVGCIRIRSRTQGIALSLGDLITVIQRSAQTQSN